jgi:hypothetical protein
MPRIRRYRLVWAKNLTPPASNCDFSSAIFEVTLFFFESYYIRKSYVDWYFFTNSAFGVITWPSWGYFLGNSFLFRKSTEYWIPPLNETFVPTALTALPYDPTGAIFLVTKFLFWKVSHIDSYVIWYFFTHIASSVIQQPWWRYFWGNEILVLNQYLILIPMWFDTFLPTSLAASWTMLAASFFEVSHIDSYVIRTTLPFTWETCELTTPCWCPPSPLPTWTTMPRRLMRAIILTRFGCGRYWPCIKPSCLARCWCGTRSSRRRTRARWE